MSPGPQVTRCQPRDDRMSRVGKCRKAHLQHAQTVAQPRVAGQRHLQQPLDLLRLQRLHPIDQFAVVDVDKNLLLDPGEHSGCLF